MWDAGHSGCHTWDYDKDTKRIAREVDVPLRIIERLIGEGLIDPNWQRKEGS